MEPEATTVNLFNYSTGKTGNGDTLGTTGSASPYVNYTTWLTGENNINRGHLLTFGDGMRHLGYWNQGIVDGYGEIALQRPGMQGIVAPELFGGYPIISDDDDSGYNANPTLYNEAYRNPTKDSNKVITNAEMIYGNAGPLYTSNIASGTWNNPNFHPVLGWNIDRIVQAQALACASSEGGFDYSFAADSSYAPYTKSFFMEGPQPKFGVNWDTGSETLPESVRSLEYLFNPTQKTAGVEEAYSDVKGLFQIDENGYYYYNMRKNFAEFDKSTNRFVLYDAPAGFRTDAPEGTPGPAGVLQPNGTIKGVGNFFPFNSANDMFNIVDGKLVNAVYTKNVGNPEGVLIDHHLGLTIETKFRQPTDGQVGNNDMTFEFVGDDDMWVFIDDVLVLDLGGIHSEVYGTINFATGAVSLGTAYNTDGEIFDEHGNYRTDPVITSTIKAQFAKAGRADNTNDWNGNTFASNTSHTLKMFYLERGNYDSSLSIKFNLQPALYQQIKKVDQDGKPLEGAKFNLYALNTPEGVTTDNADEVTLEDEAIDNQVKSIGSDSEVFASLTTDANGEAIFQKADGDPCNFSDEYTRNNGRGLLYLLREAEPPAGYKKAPEDILLRFNPETTMFVVNNRYTTGAYASFNSYVTGDTANAFYGNLQDDGSVTKGNPVPADIQEDGLVVAIPLLHGEEGWTALAGSNLTGFETIKPGDVSGDALLEAALKQASLAVSNPGVVDGWYLEWDTETKRLKGTLSNLPGRADRYRLMNENGDMQMLYAIIDPDALKRVIKDNLSNMTGAQRYAALGVAVNAAGENGVTEIGSLIGAGNGAHALDMESFNRNFRSVIYIPNEVRQLRVQKIDQNGKAVNGAEFSLYDASGAFVASGVTGTVDGRDGILLFEPASNHGGRAADGYADVNWPNVAVDTKPEDIPTYYLRETGAPQGYEKHDGDIVVKVGTYSIYADAGVEGDGVTVMAGVGKLAQTMVKYTVDDVNITLRDITAHAEIQGTVQDSSNQFSWNGWVPMKLAGTDINRTMDLSYKNGNEVIDYGLSNGDGGEYINPFFVTDTGFIRAAVTQNWSAHLEGGSNPSTANCDDLANNASVQANGGVYHGAVQPCEHGCSYQPDD